MRTDRSAGYEAIAGSFLAARSGIGAQLVGSWARDRLPQRASILDIGCGSGIPIAHRLLEQGFQVFGIDSSPTLIAAFRRRFPEAPSACEAAEESPLFHRTFDAAIAVGLLFLLAPVDQAKVIENVSKALRPGGRFLFSAPQQRVEWPDKLTGRMSRSLGSNGYRRLLKKSGLRPVACHADDGGNNFFEAASPGR